MSGWKRWWFLRSITVTSTSAFFRRRAASWPPKPPPTMTTCRRLGAAPSADIGGLALRLAGAESLEEVIADPERVGHRGQRRVDRPDAREEARVDHVQVVELVGPAVRVQDGTVAVGAEPARPSLVRAPGDRDLVLEIGVVGEEVIAVHPKVGEHLLQLVKQALLGLLV